MPFFSAVVPDDFGDSMRLDKFVSFSQNGISRSHLKGFLTSILLNGNPSKLSAKVKSGDRIEIEWEDDVPSKIEPEDIPLSILYEDENVTVVNKKQGMVVHPASGNWTGTLVSALLFRWGREALSICDNANNQAETLALRRPGIIHRLDKDTSGVIITARNRASEDFLQKQFALRKNIVKEYVCICVGKLPYKAGKIELNIERDKNDRKKFRATETNAGKKALTLYSVIFSYSNGKETYSLVRVRIKTGRTHQIRVHLKSLGCPILGDPIYGKRPTGTFKSATLMLHARYLKIPLPPLGNLIAFTAPLPPRFLKVMKVLRENFNRE